MTNMDMQPEDLSPVPFPREAQGAQDMGINDGSLTVAIDNTGRDTYDYRPRAALVRQTKLELGLADDEPLPSPWTIEIEPTLNCNAKCGFCSYEKDITKFKALHRANRSLELGLTRAHVMDTLASLKEAGTTAGTYWSGGGDPLVWPYITDAITYASTFSDVFVQTNGISLGKFLKTPEEFKTIRLLSLSVYAADAALHHTIAGVNSFDKVIANLERAIELRETSQTGNTINAKIMVDANNYHLLPQIVQFYRELGVDTVGLREVQDYNYGGEGQREYSVELTPEQKSELIETIHDSDYQDVTLTGFAKVVAQKAKRPLTTTHCYNALDGHFACIDAWGNVSIGNPEIGDESFYIGNITEKAWDDIWKSERHQEVIKRMDEMQREGTCANAFCRHVKANIGAQEFAEGKIGYQDRASTLRALGAFL